MDWALAARPGHGKQVSPVFDRSTGRRSGCLLRRSPSMTPFERLQRAAAALEAAEREHDAAEAELDAEIAAFTRRPPPVFCMTNRCLASASSRRSCAAAAGRKKAGEPGLRIPGAVARRARKCLTNVYLSHDTRPRALLPDNKNPLAGLFGDGQYRARTSDLRLVEEINRESAGNDRSARMAV
jgi:hypothetical protein